MNTAFYTPPPTHTLRVEALRRALPVTLLAALLAAPVAWAEPTGGVALGSTTYLGTKPVPPYPYSASGNTGVIVDNTIYTYAYGGNSDANRSDENWDRTGTASGNKLTITNTGAVDSATGGYANGGYSSGGLVLNASALNNELTILGTVRGGKSEQTYGGRASAADSATTKENKLFIKRGATVETKAYGGYSLIGDAEGASASATGNEVEIEGLVNDSVYGGYAVGGERGTGRGTASDNKVTIKGGTVTNVVGGYVTGDASYTYPDRNADENEVTITDGSTVEGGPLRVGGVVGGLALGAAGSAWKNKVTITGSKLTGLSDFSGATGGSGTFARENTVTITNSTVDGYVRGGSGGDARKNTVTITGGTVGGDVCGGDAQYVYESTVSITDVEVKGGVYCQAPHG